MTILRYLASHGPYLIFAATVVTHSQPVHVYQVRENSLVGRVLVEAGSLAVAMRAAAVLAGRGRLRVVAAMEGE